MVIFFSATHCTIPRRCVSLTMSQALIRFLDYRWSCRCHRISSFLRKTRWIFPHFLILILLQTKWISKDTLLTNKITQVYFHKTETFFFDSQCFKIPQKVTFYNIASEASYFYVLPINLWFLTFFMILKIDFFYGRTKLRKQTQIRKHANNSNVGICTTSTSLRIYDTLTS